MPTAVASFGVALLGLALIGFWPQYLSRQWAPIDAYTHVHAALGLAWLAMLIVQPLLVLQGRRSAHRRVGRSALVLAPAFVVSGLLLAHFRFSRMSPDTFDKEVFALYLPLAVALLFGAACVLGLLWRRSTAVHACFMVSTGLLLLDPVLGRILFFNLPPLPMLQLYQAITFTLIAAASFGLLRWLPPSLPGRNAYRNYCCVATATLLLFFGIPHTAAWRAFGGWFRALPLT